MMLSDTIRDIRRRNYLSQTAFANRIGVTQGTVSQWENGLTRPNAEQLRSISSAFNISIDDLLAGEKTPEKQPEDVPKTSEARILAKGIDKLPKAQREQALNVVKAMFAAYSDYFERGNPDDDSEL